MMSRIKFSISICQLTEIRPARNHKVLIYVSVWQEKSLKNLNRNTLVSMESFKKWKLYRFSVCPEISKYLRSQNKLGESYKFWAEIENITSNIQAHTIQFKFLVWKELGILKPENMKIERIAGSGLLLALFAVSVASERTENVIVSEVNYNLYQDLYEM